MAIDRQYIFNEVVWHLKQETKFFTSSKLQIMIGVDAFRRIAEDIRFPKTNFSSYLNSGTWTLSMPADFIKVDETDDVVFNPDTSGVLGSGNVGIIKIPPRTRKLIGRDMILSAVAGTPQYYFMEDQSTMGFYPPSMGGTAVVPYVQLPTALSSDTATNQLTERAYPAAIYWTVTQCLLMDDDERYVVYQSLYDREILRLQRQFGEMFEEDSDMIPDENYTRG